MPVPRKHPTVDLVPLRAHLGVSQSELARLLGTSHVTINRAEQGHTRLTGLPALLTDLLARACETTDGAELRRRLQNADARAIDLARVLVESSEPTASRMRKTR